jgi:hypothetical protein
MDQDPLHAEEGHTNGFTVHISPFVTVPAAPHGEKASDAFHVFAQKKRAGKIPSSPGKRIAKKEAKVKRLS